MRQLTCQALLALFLSVAAVGYAAPTCSVVPSYYPVSGPHQHGYHMDLDDRTGSKTKFLCGTDARRKASSWDFNKEKHPATDIFAELDTPLVAVADGTINVSQDDGKGFGGNSITLTDSCGTKYYYAHLNRFADGMETGRQVSAGTVIGYMGKTGNAAKTMQHLHISITTAAGTKLNPYLVFAAVEDKACTQ